MNCGPKRITILGIGNLLFRDEGLGIHVVQRLKARYEFPDNVQVLDGGVLGLSLLGAISEADHLIVIDAVKKGGKPGELHRLRGDEVPRRFLAKTSLHQVDFAEALTAAQVLDRMPQTVVLGLEPLDIDSLGLELTPGLQARLEVLLERVLKELGELGIPYREKDGLTCA
jgi:hydrogenase maturation protease